MRQHVALLCVDDHAATLFTMSTILRRAGYNVFTATTAREAIEIVSEQPIALVLLDGVGNVDGISASEALKQLRPDMQVILHSGNPDVWGAKMPGIDGSLPKPASPHTLVTEVMALLGSPPKTEV